MGCFGLAILPLHCHVPEYTTSPANCFPLWVHEELCGSMWATALTQRLGPLPGEWPCTPGPPLDPPWTPPPPTDQSDHSGKKRNLQLGKFGWAIFGTQNFGSQPPLPPLLILLRPLPKSKYASQHLGCSGHIQWKKRANMLLLHRPHIKKQKISEKKVCSSFLLSPLLCITDHSSDALYPYE